MFFPHFDVIKGFAVDYMHCALLGVVRQFVSLWFDSHNHGQRWYIGTKIRDANQRLVKITPPHEITRVPRKLDTRKFWKASEWRSFLLYSICFARTIAYQVPEPQVLTCVCCL